MESAGRAGGKEKVSAFSVSLLINSSNKDTIPPITREQLTMKSLVAAILLFLSWSVLAQQATLTRNTNLRTTPSITSPVIRLLRAGEPVSVINPVQGQFLHVRTSSGQEGWAWSKNIRRPIPAVNASIRKTPSPKVAFLLTAPETTLEDRAHTVALKAPNAETHQCEDVTDFESCHKSYAEGCTDSSKPNTYDAFLSYIKNLLPSPTSSEAESVGSLNSLADFQSFDKQSIALELGKQKQAPFAGQLADIGQGNIYTATGYIYYAIVGGIETCNCKLTNPLDRDFHIGLGFDAALAEKIRDGEVTNRGKNTDPEVQQTSIIVEMTPHYRGQYHDTWTLPKVQQLEGRQVKIVGQLIVDNEHNTSDQNCAFDDHGVSCWRGSAWELHPVTQVYICTAAQPCKSDSKDGWVQLDALVEH
jgi:uncharacterized protein YraI